MKYIVLIITVLLLSACSDKNKLVGNWDVSSNMSIGDVKLSSDGTFTGSQYFEKRGTFEYNDGVLVFSANITNVLGTSKEEWIYTDVKFISDNKITAKNTYNQSVTMTRR
ncbi:MAG: hypothetical protein CL811_08285 [Colwelliaceae bacterium]|nr:hypothetical protein [Colwelliaceae bacterium]